MYKCPNCGHEGVIGLREVVSGIPLCSKCGAFTDEIKENKRNLSHGSLEEIIAIDEKGVKRSLVR